MYDPVKIIDEMFKLDKEDISNVKDKHYVKITYYPVEISIYNKNLPDIVHKKTNWLGEQVKSKIVPACVASLEEQRLRSNPDIVVKDVIPFTIRDSDYDEDLKKLCMKGKPDGFKAIIIYGYRKYQVYEFKYEEYATFRNYLLENNINNKNVKIHPIYNKK